MEKCSHFSSLKHCRFSLGTRGNVDKYIKQFTEIFTEEGRRAVKITHQVIGQKPVITHTHPPHTTSSATSAQSGVDSAQAQSIITQATNRATSLAGQVCAKYKIRMHSSMMRTALSIRGGGGSAQPPPLDADLHLGCRPFLDANPSGHVTCDPCWETNHPVNSMTGIKTFPPQTSFAGGNKLPLMHQTCM